MVGRILGAGLRRGCAPEYWVWTAVNSFLLTLAALAVLVLSALFAAPLFIDWNDYRSVFETQATNLLGRQVKVGGKVNLILLPAPELKFDDIKVADREGRLDRPLLQAQSLEALLNIGALLTGTVEARKLVIVDPVLRLDLQADGTGNWGDVGRRGVALPFAPKEVTLDEVSVSGGRIEMTKQGEPQFTLENVAAQASAQSLSGPYKVSATYSVAGRPQEVRFSTSEPDPAGLFRIKSMLRDIDRNTSYVLDGGVTGLGAIPTFDGNIVVRAANTADVPAGEDEREPAVESDAIPVEPQQSDETSAEVQPGEISRFELKGALKATPNRAELPEFDLTLHAKGQPQIFEGKLTLDFGERIEGAAELTASFIDLDALFAVYDKDERPSPAAVLYMLANEVLDEAVFLGDGSLAMAIEQAGLGGDLVGAVDLALAAKDGAVAIEHLKAVLPGDNRIEVEGTLKRGKFGPVFSGPVTVEGSGLRPLTRWAGGNRDMSGQASTGDFAVRADAVVGDGTLQLANASGELSGTEFRGGLRLQGGERRLIELNLDSERLDLRELIGDGPLWQLWLPASATDGAAQPEQDWFKQLRGDDMRVTLHVGELLLPDIPPGKLDAQFALQSGTLDIDHLDFAAADVLVLNAKGRIERLEQAPSGRLDLALRANTGNSLKIAAELLGLPDSVSGSQQLSLLAPLDLNVGMVASREGDLANATIEIGGRAATSSVALKASAVGELAKLGEARVDVDGEIVGENPQAFLVLLFPDLPLERIATPAGSQGRLVVKFAGVPNHEVTGKAALETLPIEVAFVGQGSTQPDGLALSGEGAVVSRDATAALTLLGFESPPSASGVPVSLRFDVAKQGAKTDLNGIAGTIAGEKISGSVRLDQSGPKTRFSLNGSAGAASLPSLLGVLVAWHGTPSTEIQGTSAANTSEVWPLHGFSLQLLDKVEGGIEFKAKTLALGSSVKLQDAVLAASVGTDGLAITDLKGRLFGGNFAGSGNLAPRGNGAELNARAQVKGGKLGDLTKSVIGAPLATGPFDLAFDVQGAGLSPPGIVAGLSGKGTLVLGAGRLQSFSVAPLRKVAATAANETIKADKERIAAETRAVREKITKGTYKFAPAKFALEIKNGTLSLGPAELLSAGAETKINGYIELASLKLDSEWAVRLTGNGAQNVPPTKLVFTGTLDNAGQIDPAIDTDAIESHLTMRRMQEDVERLETLDVSGRTLPPAPAQEDGIAALLAEEQPLEPESPSEPEALESPAETVEPDLAEPPTAPSSISTAALPSALELLEGRQKSKAGAPRPAAPAPAAAAPEADEAAVPAKPDVPPLPVRAPRKPAPVAKPKPAPAAEPKPAPVAEPAQSEPAPSQAATADPEAEPSLEEDQEEAKPQRPRSAKSRRKPEPPDAWRKGISIFGGG